ncbi:ATP-binding protein [Vibrio sp. MEBiC08052]|uniref:ATP-binding protein n=1 Tax=Vibrio sp. MEBiC08052 TaxID=1761910 RepID=UPI00074075C3|nr:ATP-binding protein [Vibrio sp. MEBiC08052]KUI97295.1 hypothetical protein VRK_34840 [Vibrio sp. MEBiC08052]
MSSLNKAKVIFLVGKVACGKTSYARKMQDDGMGVFLSLDELQLDIFGSEPTRQQLDDSYQGCENYLKRMALQFLKKGITVYLDWGFWKRSERQKHRQFFESEGFFVEQIYFNIPLNIRLQRNLSRNSGNDIHSFKIEEKDISLFDGFFEEPDLTEQYIEITD